jgi:hypothetical protein
VTAWYAGQEGKHFAPDREELALQFPLSFPKYILQLLLNLAFGTLVFLSL